MNKMRAMVLGMARSGIGAAELLLSRGAEVWLCDRKELDGFNGALDALIKGGAHLLLGEAHPEEHLSGMDMLVVSPGIRIEHPAIQRAKALGVEVMGEIELAYRESKGLLLAVTGTNGKTTTTTLVGEIFKNAGKTTHVVGNIGVPYSLSAIHMGEDDVTVCEISSFMMETSKQFHPHVAAVLNISEDHMDRHHTMENYIALKERIFENSGADDFVVLNYDDPVTRDMANRAGCKAVWFSSKREVPFGAFTKEGTVVFGAPDAYTPICRADEIVIPGEHNLQNALAAAAMTMLCGVSAQVVAHTLRTFQGVEHRIEFVREINGVRFINDSKGTNVDSSIQAVRAMKQPTALILGGYDKHCDFTPLVEEILKAPISRIVLIGATAPQIAETLDRCGYTAYEHCGQNFEGAVRRCFELAQPGWNVLFSPSCASFDMFTDYEARGRIFKEITARIAQEAANAQ